MGDTSIRATLEAFWDARLAGDKAAMNSFLAPNATYEMNGADAFADRRTVGPHDMRAAAAQLVDTFIFHGRETISIIVDGNRAVMVSRFNVAFRDGKPVTTIACDVWEFDGDGKAVSMKEFVDTDLVRRMMAREV